MAKILVEQPYKIGDIVLVSTKLQFEYITSNDLKSFKEKYTQIIEKGLKPIVQLIYAPEFTGTVRAVFKYELPKVSKGVITGWTVKKTGRYYHPVSEYFSHNGYLPPEQATLESDAEDYHKVWIVSLFNETQRYRKEIFVLEEDITILKKAEV